MTWLLTQKPSFLTQLLALPPRDSRDVLEKIGRLLVDPTPDGSSKKALHHLPGLFRLRSGDYRVLYSYREPYVSVLEVRRRNEATYDGDLEAEDLGGFDAEVTRRQEPDWSRLLAPRETAATTPLPERLTSEFLERLRVPVEWHARLGQIETREALFEAHGIPDDVKVMVDDAVFGRPIDDLIAQPDLVSGSVDDLLRFKEGSLLTFLLRLDPEQERLVAWALDADGPTLVKGGPGSGKSTVALYRCKSLLGVLGESPRPRILFTTYTNALVAFSRQLLDQLLGPASAAVEVRTADSVAMAVVRADGAEPALASRTDERALLKRAIETASFEGNSLRQRAQAQAIERLPVDYLLEEIGSVIEARGFDSVASYSEAARPGRRLALKAMQRAAVWTVASRFRELLAAEGLTTWDRLRRRAAELVAAGRGPEPYDAVVVDEAQDLGVSLLRMLAGLCRAPNRLFVTADANQSIYGSGFQWTDVHDTLRFRGRTAVLRANHRSTEAIGKAAGAYLGAGGLEAPEEPAFSHSGPAPAVRAVASPADELALVARFLQGAAREFRLGPGAGAVLVPTEAAGRSLAGGLVERGVQTEFMAGKDLDLRKPVVKVVTLKSAKGLEFPVVAVAGFLHGKWPIVAPDATPEARDEALALERRSLFVAMTRAMRALLVVVPEGADDPLSGFAPGLWNLGEP